MLARSKRQLARMLNLPQQEAESLELNGRLRKIVALPLPPDQLIQTAIDSRPDLTAYRLGLHRAEADVRLARANRASDIYLVYQPYTDQAGRAFGEPIDGERDEEEDRQKGKILDRPGDRVSGNARPAVVPSQCG